MNTQEQQELINNLNGKSIYLIDENNNILGTADTTRLDKANKWQRFLSRISKRYKKKFIDVKGFTINNEL